VSEEDLRAQLYSAIRLFPGVNYTERLNLHYARMGDPIFNDAVFKFSHWARRSTSVGIRIDKSKSYAFLEM
jgi:adenine C2-methylase RlmN of 23S rRNA A2503 and tRNA A37